MWMDMEDGINNCRIGKNKVGEFMQGWFHGHGIYTTIDGTKFEGKPWP